MSGVQDNGRAPTLLSDKEGEWFDARYAVIVRFDRGVIAVLDEQAGTWLTFSQFEKLYGVRGTQWLHSDRKQLFGNLGEYHAYRAQHPRSNASGDGPHKNPYRRGMA